MKSPREPFQGGHGGNHSDASDLGTAPNAELVGCLKKAHEFLERKGPRRALKAFQECVERFPQSGEAHYWLGNVYFFDRQHDKAVAELEEAVRLEPENLEGQAVLGRLYSFDEKKLDDAEEILEFVLDRLPFRDDVRFDLARVCAMKQDFDQAFRLFAELLSGEERFGVYRTELGKILAALGRNDEARREFQRALQISPGFEPARDLLQALDQHPGPPLNDKKH